MPKRLPVLDVVLGLLLLPNRLLPPSVGAGFGANRLVVWVLEFPPNGFEAVLEVLPKRLVPVVVLVLLPKRLPAGFCWLLPKRDVVPV